MKEGPAIPKHYIDRDAGTKDKARALRRNMTKEERKLWYELLRDLPIKFQRQYPIDPYIVDFYCHSRKLVLELDGGQHYEERQQGYDTRRTEYFVSQGLTVLRYSNLDVSRNWNGVCEDILRKAAIPCPSP